jgi:hypothetical protein
MASNPWLNPTATRCLGSIEDFEAPLAAPSSSSDEGDYLKGLLVRKNA